MIHKRTSESEEDMEELNEDDVIYVGDVDEVLEALDDEENLNSEDEEFDPPRDDAFKTFVHSDADRSVFCGSIHPNNLIVATGTEGDKLHIWSVDGNLKNTFDFEDSVIASEFNFDGTLLAAADMAGNIKVFNVTSEPYTLVYEYNTCDIMCFSWHNKANVIFCGTVTGDIHVLKVPKGDCKILMGPGCKANCTVVLPDGVRLAVGYVNGLIKIWDIKSASAQAHLNVDSEIITIDSHADNNLVMVGTSDGRMILINTINGKILHSMSISEKSVESVVFYKNPDLNLAAIGSLSGTLIVWDVARNAVRHQIEVEAGVVKIYWLPGAKILSAHLDGCTRLHDARTAVTEKVFMGHRKAILDMAISKDSNKFVTVSDDGTAKLFDVATTAESEAMQ